MIFGNQMRKLDKLWQLLKQLMVLAQCLAKIVI
jgi:hypothetical protein